MGADTLIDFQYSIRAPWDASGTLWLARDLYSRGAAECTRAFVTRARSRATGDNEMIYSRGSELWCYAAITVPGLSYIRKGARCDYVPRHVRSGLAEAAE